MHTDDGRQVRRVIVLATAMRLLVAATLPLGIDESYEAVVSRTLSLSYFDHPPAVFWIAHAAAWLGGESPFAMRWPFVLLFALTSWLLYRLTARLFGTRAGFWAVLTAQLIPVFSLSSGGWVLPDGPLLCASIAAALALSHALPVGQEPAVDRVASPSGAWAPWLAFGLAMGLAGLSKYHAVLLALGALLFLASDTHARSWLRRGQPWLSVLIAAACALPVFLWNAQHDWISFRFQAGRAAGHGSPLTALLQNLGGQAGYILPWFWVPLIALLVRGLRTGRRDRATWFCCCLGAVPVAIFTLASLGGRPGLPHWPAPGYFMLLPLLGAAIMRWEQRAPAVARRRMTIAGVVYLSLVTLVVSHAATGWVAQLVPSLHRRDPAFELLEYRSLRDTLTARGLLQPARFIATTDWMRGSKIGYALGPGQPVLVLNDDMRHFQFSSDVSLLRAADGLLIAKVARDVTPDEARAAAAPYRTLFDSLQFVSTVPVLRGADTALLVSVFTAQRFRGRVTP